MDQATHNKIVSFIWGIADDVLRDLFKRGKYPDVILPMCVIRRMDAVLEPTKPSVLDTKRMLDKAGITEQRAALAIIGLVPENVDSTTYLRSVAEVQDGDKVYSERIHEVIHLDALSAWLDKE